MERHRRDFEGLRWEARFGGCDMCHRELCGIALASDTWHLAVSPTVGVPERKDFRNLTV